MICILVVLSFEVTALLTVLVPRARFGSASAGADGDGWMDGDLGLTWNNF